MSILVPKYSKISLNREISLNFTKWAKSASLGKRGIFCLFLGKPTIIFLIRMVNKLVLQFETCPQNLSKKY